MSWKQKTQKQYALKTENSKTIYQENRKLKSNMPWKQDTKATCFENRKLKKQYALKTENPKAICLENRKHKINMPWKQKAQKQ